MKTYSYMAVTEPGDDPSIVIVTFPDVPEAITEGHGLTEALINAEDALAVALLSYPLRGKPVPEAVLDHGTRVTVAPDVAAKLALLEAFQSSGMTKSDFARRLGKDEKEVRRLLDPMHASKLPALVVALGALGKRLVIGVEDRAA